MKTCCPHGTECDVAANKCTTPPINLIPLPKENSEEMKLKSGTVCPDKKMDCQKSETCCSVGYGSYGCCPFPNVWLHSYFTNNRLLLVIFSKATCCSDNATCCPAKKKCDLMKKMCVPAEEEDSKIVGRKSLIKYFSRVGLSTVCPNGDQCSGNETCCLTNNNDYGCCPYRLVSFTIFIWPTNGSYSNIMKKGLSQLINTEPITSVSIGYYISSVSHRT